MRLRTLAIAIALLVAIGFVAGKAGWAPPFRNHGASAPPDGRFRVELATVANVGALSEKQVDDALRLQLDRAYDCWRDGNTRFARNTTLRLKINVVGLVTETEVVSSSGIAAVDQCIARAASRSVFPFATSGSTAFATWMETPTPVVGHIDTSSHRCEAHARRGDY